MSIDALEFKVGNCYSVDELKESLNVSRFMPHYSMWSDGLDTYLFHHLPFRQLKIKYQLEKVVYKRIDADVNNCFSPARMGL